MADVNTSVNTTLTADTRGFTAGMTQASQSLTQFGKNTTMSGAKMAALAGAVGGLASTIGMSFMQMANQSARFAFNTVADFEQTRIGFEGILQSGEKAKSFLSELQQFAAKTPFEFTELANSSKQLLAVGFAASDILPIMGKLGDTAANLGLGSDALKMTIRAIGQIRGAGKAMTQDLYQITNALPGFNPFKAIGDDMGKTQAETRKMIEQGLIPADQAINAILAGMAAMPGAAGAMSRQVDTIKGQMSNLKDAIQINLIEAFNNTKPAVNGLKSVVAGVGPAIKFAFSAAKTILAPLGPIFKTLAAVVKTLFMAFKPLATVVGVTLAVAFKAVTAALDILLTPIRAVAEWFQKNKPLAQGLATAIGILTAAWVYNTNAVKINTFVTKVWAAVTKAATAVMLLFRDGIVAVNLLMATNPAVVIIAGILALAGAFIWAWKKSETFREIVTEVFDFIGKTVGSAVAWIAETLGKYLNALSEVLDASTGFGNGIRQVFDFIWQAILKWAEIVVGIFQIFLKGLAYLTDETTVGGKIVAGVFNFVWSAIMTAVQGMLTVFGWLMDGIAKLTDPTMIVGKVMAGIFDFIYQSIFKSVGFILNILGTLLLKFAQWADDNRNWVNLFIKIITFMPKTILNVAAAILNIFGNMFKKMGELFADGAEKVAGWMRTIANAISQVPKMDWLAEGINKAANSLSGFGTKVKTNMTAVGDAFIAAGEKLGSFTAKLVPEDIGNALITTTKVAGKAFIDFAKTMKSAAALEPAKALLALVSSVATKASDFAKNLKTMFGEIGKVKIGDVLTAVINKGATVAIAFTEGVQKGIEKAKEYNLGTLVIDKIQETAKKAGSFLTNLAATITAYTSEDFTSKVAQDLGDFFSTLKDKLGFGSVDDLVKETQKTVDDAKKTADGGAGTLIKDQAAVMEKVREALKKGLDVMQGVVDDLKKAAMDMASGLKDAIVSFAGLKGVELPDGFIPQAKSLIRNMEMRLQKSQEFAGQIAQLESLGLNTKALQDIIESGPIKGAQLAASILGGGLEAIAQVNRLTKGISAAGELIGNYGATAVYGTAITGAEKALEQQKTAAQSVQFAGGQVIVDTGAINLVVNIKGAKDDQEVVTLVTDAVEQQFNILAQKLAVTR